MGCSLGLAGLRQIWHQLCVAALHDLDLDLFSAACLAEIVLIFPQALVHAAFA